MSMIYKKHKNSKDGIEIKQNLQAKSYSCNKISQTQCKKFIHAK